jgi:hypothetical protein
MQVIHSSTRKLQHARLPQLVRPGRSFLIFSFICKTRYTKAAPIPSGPSDKIKEFMVYWTVELSLIAFILTPYVAIIWGFIAFWITVCHSPESGTPWISGSVPFGASFAWWIVRWNGDMPTECEAFFLSIFAAFWCNYVTYCCRPMRSKRWYLLSIIGWGILATSVISAFALITGPKFQDANPATVWLNQAYDIGPGMLAISSLAMYLFRGDRGCSTSSTPQREVGHSTRTGIELSRPEAGPTSRVGTSQPQGWVGWSVATLPTSTRIRARDTRDSSV